MNLTKVGRFIKHDPEALQEVNNVLLKYYAPIRDEFFLQAAEPLSYPSIDWLAFTNNVDKWQILDRANLLMSDVDRIFIATNVELEEQEANDDRSLCRFEFYEILVRLAKLKFYEKGACKTIAEAVEKLIVDHVLPHSKLVHGYREWREEYLWTCEVDDLFKANLTNLRAIYDSWRVHGRPYVKFDDILKVFMEEVKLEVTDV